MFLSELSYWDRFSDSKGNFAYPSLTVNQALNFAARMSGLWNKYLIEERKILFLEIFRLREKRHRLVRALSQGEQKKTLLAMEFFAVRGNLLIHDPFENLDEFSQRRVKALLFLISL